jgi:5-(carboxyamino)imidazole ribonucleotide synthase
MQHTYESIKLGILGGGQLGRMLIQSAINWNIITHVLDPDNDAPCNAIAYRFYNGQLTDFNTVYQFGQNTDLITIEIEHVNTEALIKLEAEGKKVFPQPHAIRFIQDKGLQKSFFQKNNIPTAPFRIIESAEELSFHRDLLPFYMKLRKSGYDGRGVQLIKSEADFTKAFQQPSVLEKAIRLKTEISVIVARNNSGEVKTYPPVGMEFHPEANLIEYLYAPAPVDPVISKKAEQIAIQVTEALKITGILAVEMFVDEDNNVLVNEVAPRPHNSGHHTIEANITSQYEQHLRAIMNMPLGDTSMKYASVMINLLGEPGYEGKARYVGINEALRLPGVYLHLYGKKITRPFRKMGHVTIVADDLESAKEKAKFVKQTLKVIA